MPGFDGTGPGGKGPMSGGCRGFCVLPLSPASRKIRGQAEELLYLKSWAKMLRNRLEWIDEQLRGVNGYTGEEEAGNENRDHGT